jgi:hypothetical protein
MGHARWLKAPDIRLLISGKLCMWVGGSRNEWRGRDREPWVVDRGRIIPRGIQRSLERSDASSREAIRLPTSWGPSGQHQDAPLASMCSHFLAIIAPTNKSRRVIGTQVMDWLEVLNSGVLHWLWRRLGELRAIVTRYISKPIISCFWLLIAGVGASIVIRLAVETIVVHVEG